MRSLAVVSILLPIASPLAAQGPTRVAGYETYAVVAPIADEESAQPFAERHCAKYDRFAHFRWMERTKAIFDCDLRKLDKPAVVTGRGVY